MLTRNWKNEINVFYSNIKMNNKMNIIIIYKVSASDGFDSVCLSSVVSALSLS